jgi:hypothetical protein
LSASPKAQNDEPRSHGGHGVVKAFFVFSVSSWFVASWDLALGISYVVTVRAKRADVISRIDGVPI